MKLFVIHRFKDRKEAKGKLKNIAKERSLHFDTVFLDSSGGKRWKKSALNAIAQAEAIIIFNKKFCEESKNALWEIEKAVSSGKEIIEINSLDNETDSIEKLKSLYDLNDEFEACFGAEGEDVVELYKIMLESSESLMERRQKTNAFFVAAIGSLFAIAAFIVKTGALSTGSTFILFFFPAIGILLCISWQNLIDNYGKLNKAKFDVIIRLEKYLKIQIYSAEWVALGKGLRAKKYKSFTSTEKKVPYYFGALIIIFTLIAVLLQILGWQSCTLG